MKYFIDDNVWFDGKRQPPRRVNIGAMTDLDNGQVRCIDDDGDEYTLDASEIKED